MKKDIWGELVTAIAANPQGMVLFLMGAAVITFIQIVNRKEIIRGHKGANGLWEPAEWTLYWFSWVCPFILMGSACKVMDPPDMVWYFLGFMLIYGLMGNKGIEMILAWRGLGNTSSTVTTEKSSTTIASQSDTKT